MSSARPRLTIMVHKDGDPESRSLSLPLWLARAAAMAGVALLALLVLAAALYLPVARAALSVPGLRRDVARLEADNAKVRELIVALDSAEKRYDRLRGMIGADLVPDAVAFSTSLPIAPTVDAALPRPVNARPRFEAGPSEPRHWPLSEPGFITRGNVSRGSRDEEHPGVDIAVPVGTMVRAAGGGTVLEAGRGEDYGNFVLLGHPQGYQSMYGHLSRITVQTGQPVSAGSVIGLSGNTGRSSAPHLHFEIRQGDQNIDPLSLVQEARR